MIILRQIFFIIISLISVETFSQTSDTVVIFKSECGVPYKIYTYHWFHGRKSSYSYNPKKVNHQDSIVLYKGGYYLKLYDKPNGRLILEGKDSGYGVYLIGDIKYYHKDGWLERIEHYNNKISKDTCGKTFSWTDAPTPEGKWIYFRSDGSTYKQLNHYIKVISCKDDHYAIMEQTVLMNKKGEIVTTSQKPIHIQGPSVAH